MFAYFVGVLYGVAFCLFTQSGHANIWSVAVAIIVGEGVAVWFRRGPRLRFSTDEEIYRSWHLPSGPTPELKVGERICPVCRQRKPDAVEKH